MSTPAQITAKILANRQNAQLSTRPVTEAGKSVSSQNAVRHGLSSGFSVLPWESQPDFDALLLRLVAECNPHGEHETLLVRQMAEARWRLARVDRMERAAFELLVLPDHAAQEIRDAGRISGASPDFRAVAGMARNGRDPLTTLQRYRADAERSYYKAQRALEQNRKANGFVSQNRPARAEQITEPRVPEPQPQGADSGFVSENHPARAPQTPLPDQARGLTSESNAVSAQDVLNQAVTQ